MVYACDNNACESSRQFVESQSNPHYLVFVVFNIEESVIWHCRCYIAVVYMGGRTSAKCTRLKDRVGEVCEVYCEDGRRRVRGGPWGKRRL